MSTVPQPLAEPSSHDASSLVLGGEIDLANVVELQTLLDHVITSTDGTVNINMAGVTYLDSTGLHVLLTAYDQLRQQHRQLLINRASPQVERIFELCGVATLLMNDIADHHLSAAS